MMFMASMVRSRRFHIALLALGFVFILTGAFHGNVWFDESYSVAIAGHSFSDIWSIGSGDVHPVLFYWALHVLNLVFGQNILVYRLFAALGVFMLAWLGYSVVRRDFGWRAGLLFSLLCLFTPYLSYIAVEIRMYSWAMFSVMVCALFAWRIACVLASRSASNCMKERSGRSKAWWARIAEASVQAKGPCWAGVPNTWWLTFFAASLASAYLHYYGVLSAFLINLFLLVFVAARNRNTAATGVLVGGAAIQVLLYAPWLSVVASQVGVVSGSYWAEVSFPRTFVEWAFYPVVTSYVTFADTYGAPYVVALAVCAGVAVAAVLWGIVVWVRQGKRCSSNSRNCFGNQNRFAALWGLILYVAVFLSALAASVIMGSLIVYYRYLSVALGPLLLVVAIALSSIKSKACVCGLLAALLGTACISQALFVRDAYSSENQYPLECFEGSVQEEGAVPVLSSDIGIEGVTAVTYPEVNQTFLAWQAGDWAKAYQCYSPTLICISSWDDALSEYRGKFVVLGQTAVNGTPVDVSDLEQRPGVSLVSKETFYRPYERTWFTIAVMEKL